MDDGTRCCSINRISASTINKAIHRPNGEKEARKNGEKLKVTHRVNGSRTTWTWYHHRRNEYYILRLSDSFTNLYAVFKDFFSLSRIDENVMRTKRNFIWKRIFFRLLDALLCAEKSSKMLYTYCSWIVQKIDLATVYIPYKATQRNTFHTSAHWEFIFCELSHCNSASVTLNGLRMATRPAFCIPQWYWNY